MNTPGHSGMIVVKIEGTASAVESAMKAAALSVEKIHGSFAVVNVARSEVRPGRIRIRHS